MLKTTMTLACAIIALAFTANANAQGCGCGGGAAGISHGGMVGAGSFGGYGGYGNYGMVGANGLNSCGREVTNNQAAALWGGYCTENCNVGGGGRKTCGIFGGGRGHRGGRCGGAAGAFGYPGGGGCGCSQGCFGYPTGGCGCGGGFGGFGGGLFSKLKASHGGCGGGCGHGGGLFSKIKASHGGGCGLLSKCKRRNKYAAIVSYPVTTVAVDQCGCGNSGQYFNYAVGSEYGTAGMQSSVSGMLTGACASGNCGGGMSVLDAGNYGGYGNTGAPAFTAGAPCCQ